MPTARAKTMIAAVAAVLLAGVTAWPTITAGQPLRLVDLLPVAVTVVGAVQTHVVPNVPRLPWAKTVVAAAAAVLSALSTLVAADPSGLTAVKIVTVAVGALLVWYVPELAPAVQVATTAVGRRPVPGVDGRAAVTEALREIAQTAAPRPPVPAYRPPAPAGPATTELPAQAGKPPAPAAAAAEPTPIADAALAAAQTVVLPAVTG